MSQNQLEHIQNLDSLAGNFFLAGLIMSRLKDIPMGYFSFYLSAFAIVAYALAYSIQIYTSSYYDKDPDHLIDFQFLFQLQALLGAIASWTLIMNPTLWMPCLLLFLASNILWYYAECLRYDHPTNYPQMPHNPKNYLVFCAYMTLGTALYVAAGLMVSLGIASLQWLLLAKILNYLATFLAFYHFSQPDQRTQLVLNYHL